MAREAGTRLSPNEIRRPLLGLDQTLSFKLNSAQSARKASTPNLGGTGKWTLRALRGGLDRWADLKKNQRLEMSVPSVRSVRKDVPTDSE